MISGYQVGELMAKINELNGAYMAWKAKAEQQEMEILYLRQELEKERKIRDSRSLICTEIV